MLKVIWQKGRITLHKMDDSIVFARWHPCNTCFLGPTNSTSERTSQSDQLFLHSLHLVVAWLDLMVLTQIRPHHAFEVIDYSEVIHSSRGPPKSTTITAFAGLTIATDWLTDHTTLSVTTGCTYVCSTAMRPNNNDKKWNENIDMIQLNLWKRY